MTDIQELELLAASAAGMGDGELLDTYRALKDVRAKADDAVAAVADEITKRSATRVVAGSRFKARLVTARRKVVDVARLRELVPVDVFLSVVRTTSTAIDMKRFEAAVLDGTIDTSVVRDTVSVQTTRPRVELAPVSVGELVADDVDRVSK